MTSLTEVQRIIGLSLNKIQVGRSQRGGLPLHKNLLVATVLNKARDVYMQETMYMNYRLMACGAQFNPPPPHHRHEMEDDDRDREPEAEDYEEDSESDVEDDAPSHEFGNNSIDVPSAASVVGVTCNQPAAVENHSASGAEEGGSSVPLFSNAAVNLATAASLRGSEDVSTSVTITPVGRESAEQTNVDQSEVNDGSSDDEELSTATSGHSAETGSNAGGATSSTTTNSDEGFIDEADCDCDARNFCHDSENRVPFQYCYNCAPFHPSNGRGPTLVSPQTGSTPPSCVLVSSVTAQQEDKLIYDLDSKSTERNEHLGVGSKRKRHLSDDDGVDRLAGVLSKRSRESMDSSDDSSRPLDDSGYQEDTEVFHPAFRGQTQTGVMEVDQITSLVSIFSFGQQLFSHVEGSGSQASPERNQEDTSHSGNKEEDDSDSDSDTSSDSGHSSDDHPEDLNNSTSHAVKDTVPPAPTLVVDTPVITSAAAVSEPAATGSSSPTTTTEAADLSCSSAVSREATDVVGSREVTATV